MVLCFLRDTRVTVHLMFTIKFIFVLFVTIRKKKIQTLREDNGTDGLFDKYDKRTRKLISSLYFF